MSYIKYARLVALDRVHRMFEQARQLLHQEALAQADSATRLTRRLRMLSHLSEYEAQIWHKFKNFETSNLNDYDEAVRHIYSEIDFIVDRNG